MLQLKILILKLFAVDTFTTGAIAHSEVPTLNHELLDHTVEAGALVAKALLAGSKGTEVLSGL